MVKFLKNLLLYISAFVPMYFLVLLKLLVEIMNGNLTFNALNTINFILLILLILSGVFGLIWNVWLNHERAKEIVVLKKENITDKHFLGYFSLFVFFAIPLEFEKVSVFCVIFVILIFIGIVYINNSLYYISMEHQELYSIQRLLKEMQDSVDFIASNPDLGLSTENLPSASVQMAIAVIGILPILIAYPFFQKGFVAGISLGGVKE